MYDIDNCVVYISAGIEDADFDCNFMRSLLDAEIWFNCPDVVLFHFCGLSTWEQSVGFDGTMPFDCKPSVLYRCGILFNLHYVDKDLSGKRVWPFWMRVEGRGLALFSSCEMPHIFRHALRSYDRRGVYLLLVCRTSCCGTSFSSRRAVHPLKER